MELTHLSPLKHIKAVLLDWAGTTVDFGCFAPVIAFTRLFEQYNVKISEQVARASMGLNKREHIIAILSQPHVSRAWLHAHGTQWEEEDVDMLYHSFLPLQNDVVLEYGTLIPDTLDTIEQFKLMGLKIASNTGYNDTIMQALSLHARHQGYRPDVIITGSDVMNGRPTPWMALKAAEKLDIYPMSRIVKIGDTIPDIAEGLNAGMWTIAVIHSSSEMGLTLEQLQQLSTDEKEERCHRIKEKFLAAGCHYVINTLSESPQLLYELDELIIQGKRPA